MKVWGFLLKNIKTETKEYLFEMMTLRREVFLILNCSLTATAGKLQALLYSKESTWLLFIA